MRVKMGEELVVMSWWLPQSKRDRFKQVCDERFLRYQGVLTKLVDDFCEGKIYELPEFRPKQFPINFKNEDGKWEKIPGEEFSKRMEKKKEKRKPWPDREMKREETESEDKLPG
jgi:hypothetical protein